MNTKNGLCCLQCGENLIRESPLTPVGASIFEHQDERPRLRCSACGAVNTVKWNPDSGFQSIALVSRDCEDSQEETGLFCLNCRSRMELSPPPWKKPTEIIEVGKRALAVCGTCGWRNEIDTVDGKTIAVKLA
ncbi:MAG: zinc ribbon domain-containing protein [Candidatus Eiseniibacteriota bacterium]|nr:MAG: zinc ribbon domain-containing protein [Candidatus Eisenbacteria bacterium]